MLYDELVLYAKMHHIDVVVIQETKWSFCSEWETPGADGYCCIHAGIKHGGLLVMLSKRRFGKEGIRHVTLIPGRLMWVRISMRASHLTIIAFYQHAWHGRDANVLERRHTAWMKLSQCLSQVAQRDFLVVLGDFNTPCRQESFCVGPAHCDATQN